MLCVCVCVCVVNIRDTTCFVSALSVFQDSQDHAGENAVDGVVFRHWVAGQVDCSVLQCVGSVLQCVAVCCSMLQCVAV